MSKDHKKSCEVALDLKGLGWLAIHIKAGDEEVNIKTSYLESGPVELVMAILAFFSNSTPQSIYLEQEPGNPVLRLDWEGGSRRASGYVHLRIGYRVPMVGEEDASDRDIAGDEFDAIIHPHAFQKAIVGALIDLIERYGPEGVNERWGRKHASDLQMTEHHLALLRDLFVHFEYYAPDEEIPFDT